MTESTVVEIKINRKVAYGKEVLIVLQREGQSWQTDALIHDADNGNSDSQGEYAEIRTWGAITVQIKSELVGKGAQPLAFFSAEAVQTLGMMVASTRGSNLSEGYKILEQMFPDMC